MSRAGLSVRLARTASFAPRWLLKAGLTEALGERHVALCLHRVGRPRGGAWEPELTAPPGEIDALADLLLASRPRARSRWLSLTFDDGYEDAAEYVATRAARYPEIEFVLFVCPEKAEQRVGFRWDLAEQACSGGVPARAAARRLQDPLDVEHENDRRELRALQAQPRFQLASVPSLREVARLENVRLGNHTNCHFCARGLPDGVARRELERSCVDFRRLFGPLDHFAFPFGIPGLHFDERHVRMVRDQGAPLIWSTEARPFAAGERHPGALLPRLAILGSWSHRTAAAWIAARATIHRNRGVARRP